MPLRAEAAAGPVPLQSRPIDILVICTGNICRSPMAEAMLRRRLVSRGIPARVHSAGLLLDHEPAHPYAIDTLRGLGVDLTHHRSRILESGIVEGADLIIGMEMRHVREVLVVDPGAISRAFTLPDLVKRAEAVGPRTDPDVRRWIEELAAGRKRLDLLKKDHGLEVPDPIGGSKRKFRRTAESLGDLVDRFVELTWPQAPPSGHHGGVSETSAPIPGST